VNSCVRGESLWRKSWRGWIRQNYYPPST